MASVRSQAPRGVDRVNGALQWRLRRYGFHEDGLQSGLTAARRVEERAGMEALA